MGSSQRKSNPKGKHRTPMKSLSSQRRKSIALTVAVFTFCLLALRNASYSGDPLSFMIPNALLFTPFHDTTRWLWKRLVRYDTTHERAPIPIREVDAKEFSFDNLHVLTNGFRSPAVVRGLFADTPALERWSEPGYLSSFLGDYEIVAVNKGYSDKTYAQRSVTKQLFKDAFGEILSNENSTKYLFFPEASKNTEGFKAKTLITKDALGPAVDAVVRRDLDLSNRLWQGFGTSQHSTYIMSQIIAGRGKKRTADSHKTTGSNWHCAVGNNYFVQVAGRKRWYFLDQKYSAYMQPINEGVNNMATGASNMEQLQKYLPVEYVDLNPGDMLYNPDFEWHKVENYEGLAIGVPIREVNVTIAAMNNLHYLAIVGLNNFKQDFLGISSGV